MFLKLESFSAMIDIQNRKIEKNINFLIINYTFFIFLNVCLLL
ncbi:hypothetical protein LEP1GSC080_4743 [Leptospira interrogans str. FPW2026]|nr:hypothetical protein LEP1GSC080_4743 [Leptospira interrogans str. FPW2026]